MLLLFYLYNVYKLFNELYFEHKWESYWGWEGYYVHIHLHWSKKKKGNVVQGFT